MFPNPPFAVVMNLMPLYIKLANLRNNIPLYICVCVCVCITLSNSLCFVVVQLLSHVWLFMIPWTAAHQAPLFLIMSQSLLRFMSIKSVILPNHLILCHPLLLLPSVFLRIRVFSNESSFRIRWPKYWSFSFSISPSNKYSKLISFRIDWRVWSPCSPRDSWESSLQHHNSKASILHCSALFMVQLWHPYMTNGKTIS